MKAYANFQCAKLIKFLNNQVIIKKLPSLTLEVLNRQTTHSCQFVQFLSADNDISHAISIYILNANTVVFLSTE